MFTGIETMPEMTLCLTYDDGPGATKGDGPGPRTEQLAEYLRDQGIRAAFFMVGEHAAQYADVVRRVGELNHLVANHSLEHPQLELYRVMGGDVLYQIAAADSVLSRWVDGPTTFVRPPYGGWSTELANQLGDDLVCTLGHVGPIGWDINAGDYAFWQREAPVEECVDAYIEAINAARRGIVLMHDSSAGAEFLRRRNRTYELTRVLVPRLKDLGYRFIALDEIPAIRAHAERQLQFALRGPNGRYVTATDGGGSTVTVDADRVEAWQRLNLQNLGFGKIAITAPDGRYFTVRNGGPGDVWADAATLDDRTVLDVVTLGPGRVAFRSDKGYYLTLDRSDGDRLTAVDQDLTAREIFTFRHLAI